MALFVLTDELESPDLVIMLLVSVKLYIIVLLSIDFNYLISLVIEVLFLLAPQEARCHEAKALLTVDYTSVVFLLLVHSHGLLDIHRTSFLS